MDTLQSFYLISNIIFINSNISCGIKLTASIFCICFRMYGRYIDKYKYARFEI